MRLVKGTFLRLPAKEPKRDFKVGDKIRANLHHGKIEDAVVLRLDSGCNVWKFLFSLGFVSFFSIRKDREH